MKILRVTSDLYPHVIGGIGIHTHKMSEDQVQMGHDVTVFTSNISNQDKMVSAPIYRLEISKGVINLLGNTFSPVLLLKLLKKRNEYDIIHAHSHLFFSTNMCALIRRIGSAPLVITNHGIMSASAPDWLNNIYLKTLGRWTLNSADAIICYTPEEKKILIEKYSIPESKITIISNGVDTKHFYPKERKSEINNFIIVWIGRFVKGKGVDYLIRAINYLIKESLPIKLILIGTGPENSNIRKLVFSHKLSQNIEFIDYIPYEDMPEVYRNSNLFVLPSLHEGVPRTVLEAMSCGTPVIITEFSHLKDLINGAGLMFPSKNIETLAKQIRNLYNNSELRETMGKTGRSKIIQYYSWEKAVSKTIEKYREIIKKPNP
jgi:glycosyltransferase involved in cell wall biosynthesis